MSARPSISRYIDLCYVAGLLVWLLGFGIGYMMAYIQPDFFCDYLHDFAGFYSTARMALSADRGQLYDRSSQYQWLRSSLNANGCFMPALADSAAPVYQRFSEQPPMFFAVYMPFAYLPVAAAFLLSTVCFALTGAAGTILLARSCGMTRGNRWGLIFGCAASGVACYGLQLGQPDWLLLGLLATFSWSFLQRKDLIAGLTLAALTIKPQYALFLAVPPLCAWRWRIILLAAIILAAELLAVGLWFGWSLLIDYPQMLWHHELMPGNQTSMICLRGLFDWWLPPPAGNLIGAATTVGGLLLLAALCLGARRGSADWRVILAIAVVCSIFLGPHNFPYDCLILAVPAALLLPTVSIGDAVRTTCLEERLTRCLLIVYPLFTVGLLYACSLQSRSLLFCLLHLLLLGALLKMWAKER